MLNESIMKDRFNDPSHHERKLKHGATSPFLVLTASCRLAQMGSVMCAAHSVHCASGAVEVRNVCAVTAVLITA